MQKSHSIIDTAHEKLNRLFPHLFSEHIVFVDTVPAGELEFKDDENHPNSSTRYTIAGIHLLGNTSLESVSTFTMDLSDPDNTYTANLEKAQSFLTNYDSRGSGGSERVPAAQLSGGILAILGRRLPYSNLKVVDNVEGSQVIIDREATPEAERLIKSAISQTAGVLGKVVFQRSAPIEAS